MSTSILADIAVTTSASQHLTRRGMLVGHRGLRPTAQLKAERLLRARKGQCSSLRQGCHSRAKSTSSRSPRSRIVKVQARAEDLSVQDRAALFQVFGALPYLIPLLDGLRYGRFFFAQFPAVAAILNPLQPLVSLYYGFPLASLIVFFGIYSGVANNSSLSRHIRVNAMQALLLSIVLIFPSLIEQVFRGALAPSFRVSLYNTIWLFVAACVTYGSGASLLGSIARLPLVSDAANQRIF